MMGGGYAMPEKKPMMAKGGAVKGGKPMVAIMIGVGKPKGKTAMAKGGMAKKGKC
jgi:hypothetical protein